MKAVSAHGRMTAGVLTVLPIVTMLLLRVVAPGYLESMVADTDGKYMIVSAIVLMGIGYYIMKRITNIEV